VSQPTPLNVEDVVLERTPASGQPTTQFGEVVATIPLQREQAAGVITPVVKEIVRVKKVTNTINTNVVGVVRDEQATLTNNKIQ
jgi:stress response protein YsnF